MTELRVCIPTYNASLFPEAVEKGEKPEFGGPYARVLIRDSDGVRVVLGTHDYDDMRKPDIHIERQPNGWAIFLHPGGGGDPSGYVYFLDDGRSYLVSEDCTNPSKAIQVLGACARVPEIDGVI